MKLFDRLSIANEGAAEAENFSEQTGIHDPNCKLCFINGFMRGRLLSMDQDKQAIDDTLKGWIPVKERLPEDHNLVLICMTSGARSVGRIMRTNKWGIFTSSGLDIESQTNHVEYWQPLPPNP